jgi:hypothetical protein
MPDTAVSAKSLCDGRPDPPVSLRRIGSGGQIPDAPALSEEVVRIMTKPEADADDLLYLF